ncbi:hypothetical protein JQM60_01135 [Butyricicoccus pullicaecorum]|nr:hypothetical protein [Butyricicoccus pullicaecorum]
MEQHGEPPEKKCSRVVGLHYIIGSAKIEHRTPFFARYAVCAVGRAPENGLFLRFLVKNDGFPSAGAGKSVSPCGELTGKSVAFYVNRCIIILEIHFYEGK